MDNKIKPQSDKIKQILSKLDNIDNQTISDDFKIDSSKEEEILHYEEIIRKTLSLFDINYDDFIKMDGKSAYHRAIQQNPYLLKKVKDAPCPPLMALNVAKSIQPYLDFAEKYGHSVEEIKNNLKKEVEQETKESSKKIEDEKTKEDTVQSSIFSDIQAAIIEKTKNSEESQDEKLASFLY